MIGFIQNIATSPALFNVAQNTTSQVAIKTMTQAIGQPSFVLLNNTIDSHTKKHSATKEVLYQLLCLGITFALINPLFQNRAFKYAKHLYKDEKVFQVFKNPKEFKKYTELETDAAKSDYLQGIDDKLKTGDINEKFGRGMTNLISIVGSILGLAILAPILSRIIVRPIMGILEKKDSQNNNKIDTKA